jgi:hypothetical protein
VILPHSHWLMKINLPNWGKEMNITSQQSCVPGSIMYGHSTIVGK